MTQLPHKKCGEITFSWSKYQSAAVVHVFIRNKLPIQHKNNNNKNQTKLHVSIATKSHKLLYRLPGDAAAGSCWGNKPLHWADIIEDISVNYTTSFKYLSAHALDQHY